MKPEVMGIESSRPAEASGGHTIDYIYGFKGIAALMVFTGHFLIAFYPFFNASNPNEDIFQRMPILKYVVFTPASFFYNGHFAVMGFFILSGYVLSYGYFLRGERAFIISSLARRYFRLTVPIFFSCVLAYLCLRFGLFFNQDTARITHSKWLALFYTFEPSFIQMVKFAVYGVYFNFQGSQDYNNPLWVMQMVLAGSFIVYALLFLCSVVKKRYLLYIAALLLMHRSYYPGFVVGVLLCDITVNNPGYRLRINSKAVLCALLLIGVSFGNYKSTDYGIYGWLGNSVMRGYFGGVLVAFYHTIGALCIVYVLLCSGIMQAFFSRKIVTYLGTISFSIYITHFIIICSLSCLVFNALYAMLHMKALCVMVTWMVTVMVTVGVSHLFYISIEKKSDAWIKRLYSAVASYCKAVT
jgi:peptidoglycan/LPS O-acetylase OafA/YrhL